MTVALRQSRRFGRTSPVTRYWLANCVGFTVTGGTRGRVEAVFSERDPTEAETIVVRCGRRRLRRMPASAVLTVVPSDRVLVVDHVPGSVEATGRAAADGFAHLCARGWVDARRSWRRLSPLIVAALARLLATLARGGSEGLRLIRSVPWQTYARSARSGTTRLSREAWRRSSRLRTTSSRRSSDESSADEVRTTSST